MNPGFFTTRQLAKRWSLDHETLKKWRCKGIGPLYHKLNGKIMYGKDEVAEFEQEKLKAHTSMPDLPSSYREKLDNLIKRLSSSSGSPGDKNKALNKERRGQSMK